MNSATTGNVWSRKDSNSSLIDPGFSWISHSGEDTQGERSVLERGSIIGWLK
jgi:hypothetical protein